MAFSCLYKTAFDVVTSSRTRPGTVVRDCFGICLMRFVIILHFKQVSLYLLGASKTIW